MCRAQEVYLPLSHEASKLCTLGLYVQVTTAWTTRDGFSEEMP